MNKGQLSIYLYLFLFLVVAFIFYIDKDRVNNAITTEETPVKEDVSIYEKESKTIKKLENYLVPVTYIDFERGVQPTEGMYTTHKINQENVSETIKLYAVLSYLDNDGYFTKGTVYQLFDEEGKELETPKKISERKYNEERKDQIVYKGINSNKIQKMAKKIFNTEIEIPESIVYDGNIFCSYKETLDCTKLSVSVTKPTIYTEYTFSEVVDDELHIFQKYMTEYKKDDHIYIRTPLEDISKKYDVNVVTTGILHKYGQTYKTIYKKNQDGNYYWYSTEPIYAVE